MKVLITGFDAFGDETTNPSWLAVQSLETSMAGSEIIKLQLPTLFRKVTTVLKKALCEHTPDVVILVGVAGKRAEISVERIAINLEDARIPDNEGAQPIDEPVCADGEAAYFSTLPIKTITVALKEAGIPAHVSNSAGTFVCNHAFYNLLHLARKEFPALRGGFIHIPDLSVMPLETVTRALEISIATAIQNLADIKITAGTLY